MSRGLGVLVALGVPVYYLLVITWWVVQKPRRAAQGQPVQTLPSDDSPAVVGLLTGNWRVPAEATTATLLDLAARGWLDIDAVGEGDAVVRLTPHDRRQGELAPHEQQVLALVERFATSGSVPVQAISTGDAAATKAFRDGFDKAVVQRAADDGHVRTGPTAYHTFLALGFLLVPILAGFAAQLMFPHTLRDKEGQLHGYGLVAGFVAFVVNIVVLDKFSGAPIRPTASGRALATRWTGVARYLDDSESFREIGPAGVTVWDRYLAYAAAVGVAPATVAQLPVGGERPDVAWTKFTGRWRRVTIAYPRRWPPGYGRSPAAVVTLGALGFFLAARALPRYLHEGDVGAHNLLRHLLRGHERLNWIETAGSAILVAFAVAVAFIAVRLLLMTLYALADLRPARVVEGQVLRVTVSAGRRRTPYQYVAVDDGHADHVRAWLVPADKARHAGQGARVRVRVSPVLGHVKALDVLAAGTTPATPATPATALAGVRQAPRTPTLDRSRVRAAPPSKGARP